MLLLAHVLAFAAACSSDSRVVRRGAGGSGAGASGGTAGAVSTSGRAGSSSGGSVASGGSAGDGAFGGEGGAGAESPCTLGIPVTTQLPRLTNEQYDRTVRDLLGVTALSAHGDVAPSALLAPHHEGDLTAPDWQAYLTVGEAVAVQVMADPVLKTNFVDCGPDASVTDCLHDTIVTFGRRAFRRPLTEAEVARFEAIAVRGAELTATGTLDEIAEVLLNTFLVSPSFLYRAEITDQRAFSGQIVLSSHELASRLSYLIWGSTPDAELDRAADADELAEGLPVRPHAARMLQDPKARQEVASFHRRYLEAGPNTRWTQVGKDAELFPEFTSGVVTAMNEETERFFDAIVFERSGTLPELFTSPLAFVNTSTAPLYGLDPSAFGSALTEVELDPAQRPGFLTRIGFLASHSLWERTSPILRGAFIMQNVLGMEFGPEPPGPVMPGTPLQPTNRETFTALTSDPVCAGCHATFINPPGFALEAFDSIGRYQTAEADSGAPIDTVADVVIDGVPVTVRGPEELMAALARATDTRRAYAKAWVEYAYRRSDVLDDCVVWELTQHLATDAYRVLDLVADLTQTETFRLRVQGP